MAFEDRCTSERGWAGRSVIGLDDLGYEARKGSLTKEQGKAHLVMRVGPTAHERIGERECIGLDEYILEGVREVVRVRLGPERLNFFTSAWGLVRPHAPGRLASRRYTSREASDGPLAVELQLDERAPKVWRGADGGRPWVRDGLARTILKDERGGDQRFGVV